MTQATVRNKTCVGIRDFRPTPVRAETGNFDVIGSVNASEPRNYGLAPQLRARLMGTFLAAVGATLLVMTVVVVAFKLPGDVLSGVVILVVIGIFSLAFFLGRRWYVVRVDELGYQVRFVRGAGTVQARWTDVEDLTTAVVGGAECVLLRLRDGRATTIPVALIEGDKEEFVEELQRRLDAGHGYKRL